LKRKLLKSETILWKWGCISLNIVMAAVINGVIPKKDLQTALRKLESRHPLLKVRIEMDEENQPWFTSENVAAPPVFLHKKSSPGDWVQIAREEIAVDFNWQQGPLVRLVLLQGATTSEIVINCHHCISDGLAVSYLMHDVLTQLGLPEADLPEAADPPYLDHSLPEHISCNFFLQTTIKLLNLATGWRKKPQPVKTIKKEPCGLITWQLNRTQTQELILRCRQEGVSVHSGLSTAFQAAQFDVQEPKKYFTKIYTPVSVRNRLAKNIGKTFGFYSSETYIPQPYHPGNSFWDTARSFQNRIKKYTTDQKTLGLIQLFTAASLQTLAPLMLLAVKKPKIRFGYMISNLGKLDFPEHYGPYQLKTMYGPMVYINCAEKAVGITTAAGRMTFSLTYLHSAISSETVEKIRENSVKWLERAISIKS
jgi:NRPS condensation-like uncharacterized protein